MPSESDVRLLLRRSGFGANKSEAEEFVAMASLDAVVDRILDDPRLTGAQKYTTPPPVIARSDCNSSVPYFQTIALGRRFVDRMAGGVYGAQPSFASNALDENGNLVGSVQFGSIYAELISDCLGGDADEILGRHYDPIGVLS